MLVPYIAHGLLGMTHIPAPHITLPLASITAARAGIPAGNANDPFGDLTQLASFLQGFIFGLGLTIFLIGVAIAGIMRMVAFGSERRIATSNMALTAAVVGLVIMLIGTGLQSALQTVFGVH